MSQAMLVTCSTCGTEVASSESYYSDDGRTVCGHCRGMQDAENTERAGEEEQAEGGAFAFERNSMNWGVAGGALAIVIAVAWFFGGLLFLDRIFFYPPILAVLGIVAIVRGAMR